jgi:alanine dehydrogenase
VSGAPGQRIREGLAVAVIGLVKEIKDGEQRVALTPAAVGTLVGAGHRVLVEHAAGAGAGFADADYVAAGAVLTGCAQAWEAELVVKVKEPQAVEFPRFRRDLTLFAFLHLAAEPDLSEALCASGMRAYAFEDLRDGATLPILAPMSQVAGRVAGIVGPNLLSAAHGGRGVLAGGVEGAEPASAVVVGVGVAGRAAAATLTALGMQVTGIDTDAARLAELVQRGIVANGYGAGSAAAYTAVVAADLLVGAALVPGRRAPLVVTADQVRRMRSGSVIVDIAIDQGGCVETSRVTSLSEPTYVEHGVTHYCVPNMPGQFPVTATQALSAAALKPLLVLAGSTGGAAPEKLSSALAVEDGRLAPR